MATTRVAATVAFGLLVAVFWRLIAVAVLRNAAMVAASEASEVCCMPMRCADDVAAVSNVGSGVFVAVAVATSMTMLTVGARLGDSGVSTGKMAVCGLGETTAPKTIRPNAINSQVLQPARFFGCVCRFTVVCYFRPRELIKEGSHAGLPRPQNQTSSSNHSGI